MPQGAASLYIRCAPLGIEVTLTDSTKISLHKNRNRTTGAGLENVKHGNSDAAIGFGSGDFPGLVVKKLFPDQITAQYCCKERPRRERSRI